MTRKGLWTNQIQIKIPDLARTVKFHCKKYYREYDSFMNSHEIWKSDSWNLLYKLLRSKERRMKKMMTARLYIYFPYGEISN